MPEDKEERTYDIPPFPPFRKQTFIMTLPDGIDLESFDGCLEVHSDGKAGWKSESRDGIMKHKRTDRNFNKKAAMHPGP